MNEPHVAFLRAINTGERRLTNEQQIAPFLALGCTEVAAYQASGNIVFRSDDAVVARDTDRLERALHDAYGFEAPAFVRSIDELRGVVDRSPFGPDEIAATAGRIQVTFLRDAPDTAAVETVASLVPTVDRVVVYGREWYWLPREGVSASKLPVAAIESALGPMTMRTLGTVQRLIAKFG